MTAASATNECGCASSSRQEEGLAGVESNRVAIFQSSIMACGDPAEAARKVKLALKKMPGETALICFAKAMTADLPHPIKVAVWDAVRYSHIWWSVDAVLKGSVMANPIVQQAFADAEPMRRWLVENRRNNWEDIAMTLGHQTAFLSPHVQTELRRLIFLLTHFADGAVSEALRQTPRSCDLARELADFVDWRGNNILWYLAYRDDQNARGGFACPCIERELLRLGCNPNRRKMAYFAIRGVQRDVLAAVRDLDRHAVLVNDRLHPTKGSVRYVDAETGRVLLARAVEIPANATLDLGALPLDGLPAQGAVLIDGNVDGVDLRNHYLRGEPPFALADVRKWLKGRPLYDVD